MTTEERHELGTRMLELHEQRLESVWLRREMAINVARVRLLNMPLDQVFASFKEMESD